MREFFRGWRRKIGLLTLLMACVFMAGWMRSYLNQDFFLLYGYVSGDVTHYLLSYNGAIHWVYRVWSRNNGFREEEVFLIPYWSILIPLTLISLWLLLSKPKTSTHKKIPEPTANEGA